LDVRVRAWVWYCYVREVSGLKNCPLDCKVAVKENEIPCDTGDRPFYFEHIQNRGTDPDRVRKDLAGRKFKLADRVEEHWKGSASVLRHSLWKLIGFDSPALSLAQQVIEERLAENGLRRLSHQASIVYEEQRRRQDIPDRHGLTLMVSLSRAKLDDLALLAALVVEAALLGDQSVVSRVMVAFEAAISQFLRNEKFTHVPELPGELLKLVSAFKLRMQKESPVLPRINHLSSIVAANKVSQHRECRFEREAEAKMLEAKARERAELFRRTRQQKRANKNW